MKVRYTRRAAAELRSILDHLSQQSPQGARRVQARLQAVERLLSLVPEAGRRHSADPALRHVMVLPFPYLVFYEVQSTEIWIHRIRHAAQDPARD